MKLAVMLVSAALLAAGCTYVIGWNECKPGYRLVYHGLCKKIPKEADR